MFKLKLP